MELCYDTSFVVLVEHWLCVHDVLESSPIKILLKLELGISTPVR